MRKIAAKSMIGLLPEKSIEELEEFRQKHIKHPGKYVPFHISILPNFLYPEDIDKEVENKLGRIAKNTKRFTFFAKPLSNFPTSSVLYLTPTPVKPIEELAIKMYEEFPSFGNSKHGFDTYHMTIALGYDIKDQQKIVNEYIERFSYQPLELKAGYLAIFCECDGEWKVCKKFGLGIESE